MQFLSVRESESSSFGCFWPSVAHKITVNVSPRAWIFWKNAWCWRIHFWAHLVLTGFHVSPNSPPYGLPECLQDVEAGLTQNEWPRKEKEKSDRTHKMEAFGIPEVTSHRFCHIHWFQRRILIQCEKGQGGEYRVAGCIGATSEEGYQNPSLIALFLYVAN